MKPSLFQRGLAPRLIAALLYGLGAFGALAALEGSREPRAAAPAAAPTASAERATLCVESIQPVRAWAVRVDGREIAADQTTPTLWLGRAELRPDSTLVLDAEAETAPLAQNSLRIRIAGTAVARDHAVWCTQDWSVAMAVEQLARAAAPLDPEDLP